MSMQAWRAIGVGSALSLLVATAATAGPERQPLSGTPALVLTAPEGWTVERDDVGNLSVIKPKAGVGVVAIIAEAPAKYSVAEFAASGFEIAKCKLLDRTEPARLGGRAAQAFYCQLDNPRLAPLRAVMVRLDSDHVASVSRVARLDAAAADLATMDAVIASTRFEGAAAPAKAAPAKR